MKQDGFFQSLIQSMNDRLYAVIAIFAILSIISGMIYNPATGWIEGVSIIISMLVLILISSCNDYKKDKTFIDLHDFSRNESLPTIRGKVGCMQSVSIWDLVVGDVIQLTEGDKIPVDCIAITSNNLKVDQRQL